MIAKVGGYFQVYGGRTFVKLNLGGEKARKKTKVKILQNILEYFNERLYSIRINDLTPMKNNLDLPMYFIF